jgi:hypothetical protein
MEALRFNLEIRVVVQIGERNFAAVQTQMVSQSFLKYIVSVFLVLTN